MMSFAVIFLCALSGHTFGATLNLAQDKNTEDAVSKQMSNADLLLLLRGETAEEIRKVKEDILDVKLELSSKLEQVLIRMSEIEKSSQTSFQAVSEKLQIEKDKLFSMNNHLLIEVLELRKKDLDTFEKIANVESEVSRARATLVESVQEGKKTQEELLIEIKRVEKNYLEDKNEQSSKLEQVLNKISEIEKSSNVAIGDVSDRLQVEKNKLMLMNNNLSAEVLELRKTSLDTFEKIAKVESEVRDRVNLVESVEERKKIKEELLIEIKRVERNCLEDKNEQSLKLEQVLLKISEIETSSNVAIANVSDRLQVEKNKQMLMNNNLSSEVLELQKKDLDTFEKIANVERGVSRDRVRAHLLQVRLNETAQMTHSCLASQAHLQETMQKSMQTLESNLASGMRSVAVSLIALKKDLDDGKVSVQNNTNDIEQLKQEITRIQAVCSPPCENGGQCIKENVCNCTNFFTGDRCQDVMCTPPCENGGKCMTNNVCKCRTSFAGDRCEQALCRPPCENGGQCMKGNVCNCTLLFYTGDRCKDAFRCPSSTAFKDVDYQPPVETRVVIKAMFCETHDYAWKGKLSGPVLRQSGFLHIPFTVQEVVKEGIEKVKDIVDETRTLLARDNCQNANLLLDETYLILGMDGRANKNEEGETWYQYLLDQRSIVYMWSGPQSYRVRGHLDHILHNMKKHGCHFHPSL